MPQELLNYLNTQRVCAFSIEMLDGSPHAAVVHFAHTEVPPVFVFKTSRKYRKTEPLKGREISRASIIVGLQEIEGGKDKTFQADGEARIIQDEKLKQVYHDKFPEKLPRADDPDNVFFSFTPTWWRYTDWGAPAGKTIYSSDDSVVVKGKS